MKTVLNVTTILMTLLLAGMASGCTSEPQAAAPPAAATPAASPAVAPVAAPAAASTVAPGAAVSAQKLCPVMGGAIDPEIHLDYQGRRIYFCCSGCPATFTADPAKYLAILDGTSQLAAPAATHGGHAAGSTGGCH